MVKLWRMTFVGHVAHMGRKGVVEGFDRKSRKKDREEDRRWTKDSIDIELREIERGGKG
jgi:hypothetical protein